MTEGKHSQYRMCGICGFVGQIDPAVLSCMTQVLIHRGPDEEGFHLGPDIALAVRRLSLIDVQGGRKPIANEDSSIIVALKGDIYNSIPLRERPEGQRHRFRTRSDTEVLAPLYEEYGDALVHLL